MQTRTSFILGVTALLITLAVPAPDAHAHSRMIAFATGPLGHREIHLMRPDGRGRRALFKPALTGTAGTEDLVPRLSPDGRRIAFVRARTPAPGYPQNRGIYVARTDGTHLRRLTTGHGLARMDQSPTWSPDGRRIAFLRWTSGQGTALWVMNSDGTGQRRLATGLGGETIDWSSRNEIAYTDSLTFAIYVIRPDGSGQRPLSPPLGGALAEEPAWSPDGTQLAFRSATTTALETTPGEGIYIVNSDGRGVRQVTRAMDYDPAWSPNGKRLLVARRRVWHDASGNPHIGAALWRLDLRGGHLDRLVSVPDGAGWASWR
jgi:Tol biopolymer transport system component